MKRIIIAILMLSALACYGGENRLKNPGFEQGMAHWQKSGAFAASITKEEGATILHYECDGPVGWPGYSQVLDLPSFDGLYKFSADLWSSGYTDGNGPYLALEFKDADGKRISVAQSEFIPADGEWHTGALYLQIPKGTAEVKFAMLLHGLGSADFRNPSFVKMASDTKRLTASSSAIEITVSAEPQQLPFFGFGAEDNGWAYTKGNRSHGWGERELDLREERIRFLKPSFVRTFVWIGDWMPDGYLKDETPKPLRWENDLMQSKYEALSLYQELGVPVNITGVEWEMHRFGSLWEHREKTLEAYATLMEHLIKTKGFTNIKYFTLTNEPNTSFASRDGGSFELYGWFCKNLRREFARRRLDVELVASDDAENFGWFSRFVEDREVYDACGMFATHQYLKYPEWNTHIQTEFLKSRTELLDSVPNRKPLVVAEFGFHTEGWSNVDNPYMKEHAYAVQLADYAIEGFNLGVSGYCVWTMHEGYLPPYGKSDESVHHHNRLMQYGLWNYHDDTIRSVYYATSLFTRNTAKGRAIYPCVSSDETIVRATVVGDELFFVNKAVNAAKIKITGRRVGDGNVFTQATVDAQQLTDGDLLKKDKSSMFVLPPKSFGRIPLN